MAHDRYLKHHELTRHVLETNVHDYNYNNDDDNHSENDENDSKTNVYVFLSINVYSHLPGPT